MNKQDKINVVRAIYQENFDYCFEEYSDFKEIDDKKFHELRENYLSAMSEFKDYIFEGIDECDYEC